MTTIENVETLNYAEMALEGGSVARIIKDRTTLEGRLKRKFNNDSPIEHESSLVFETKIHQFIKPLKHTTK